MGILRQAEICKRVTAIPELLDQLALENSIVTLDAMGCQTVIAERILARGADYLLVLKANHQLAYEAVVKHFDQTCFRRGAPHRAAYDTFDEAHGRLVRRRVFASTEAANLETLSDMAQPAHRSCRRDAAQYQRRSQGRNRDPLLPVELS